MSKNNLRFDSNRICYLIKINLYLSDLYMVFLHFMKIKEDFEGNKFVFR